MDKQVLDIANTKCDTFIKFFDRHIKQRIADKTIFSNIPVYKHEEFMSDELINYCKPKIIEHFKKENIDVEMRKFNSYSVNSFFEIKNGSPVLNILTGLYT